MSFAHLSRRSNYRLFERTQYDQGTNVIANYAKEMDERYRANAAKIRDARLQVSNKTQLQDNVVRQRDKERDRIYNAVNKTSATPTVKNDAPTTTTMTSEDTSSTQPTTSTAPPEQTAECPRTMASSA